MAKTDLLNFLKDINYVYNDCGMYDSVSKMLDDFESEIRAMAIDEFARKLLINFNDWQMSVAEVGNEKKYETIGQAIIGIEEIAERLKERE